MVIRELPAFSEHSHTELAPRLDPDPYPYDALVPACDARLLESTPAALAPDSTAKILFMGIAGDAVPSAESAALTTLVDAALDLPEGATLTSLADLDAVFAADKLRDLLGCDSVSCMSYLGGAVGADYVLTGAVESLGAEILLSLRLLDAATSERAAAATVGYLGARCAEIAVNAVTRALVKIDVSEALSAPAPD